MGRTGRMRKFRIDEASFVDRPAQEPALGLFMKREVSPEDDEDLLSFVKRYDDDLARNARIVEARQVWEAHQFGKFAKFHDAVPFMTDETDGHTHIVWLHGARAGETTMQMVSGSDVHHDHPWMIGSDGVLVIGDNLGHGHSVDQASVFAAMQEMLIAETDAPDVVVDVVFARAPDAEAEDVSKMDDSEILAALDDGSLVAKYTDGTLVPFRSSMADGTFPIRTEADLRKAIPQVDADGDQHRVVRHIVKRARVLGLEGVLPTDGVFAEIAKVGPAGSNETKDDPMPKTNAGNPVDPSEALTKALAKIEALEKSLGTANAVSKLSETHRAHYVSLEGDSAAGFLAKSEADRSDVIDEIHKGDPVVFTSADGTEYRKSADTHVVALAQKNDKLEKRLAASEAVASNATFEKRAAAELGNLPGDMKVQTSVLKAVDGIEDEDVRKGALELLKAGNDALAKSFRPVGHSQVGSADSASAEDKLDDLAKARAEKDGIDFLEAYEKVADEQPDLAAAAIGTPRAMEAD